MTKTVPKPKPHNCNYLNRSYIIVLPPMNDKIDTKINDNFFVSYDCNWLCMSWGIWGGGAMVDTKIVPFLQQMSDNKLSEN